LSSFDFNLNNQNTGNRPINGDGIKFSMPENVFNNERENYRSKKQTYAKAPQRRKNPVISGYFVKEKSYKEIIISRINTALCCILGVLVTVSLISYYFVVIKEIKMRKLSKETIALNYDNADMQNKLDNLQSFSNVDFEVSKSNTLTRAKQVIELSAANVPSVSYEKTNKDSQAARYLGY